MSDSAIKGIQVENVSQWLSANIDGATPPYQFDLIAAGGSNLTYKLSDAASNVWILRRPPVTARLATAHDMQREWKIMQALGEHSVAPVPKMLGFCDNISVNEAPFYVMQFVDGLIIRDPSSASHLSSEQCLRATQSLVDVQARFHCADIDAIGLGDLAKTRGNYVERQLKRWAKQVESGKVRELPLLNELHKRLERHIPKEQAAPGLAHGDYRFDNTVLNQHCEIAAVLDWELCTIGDPIADFVWSLLYWAEPADHISWLLDPPTVAEQFVTRDAVIEMYAQRTGFDLSDINYYKAFSWWKQACIVEGVYARLNKGASGGMKVDSLDKVAQRVEHYLETAAQLAAAAKI